MQKRQRAAPGAPSSSRLYVRPVHMPPSAPDRLESGRVRALSRRLVGRGAGITTHPELLGRWKKAARHADLASR